MTAFRTAFDRASRGLDWSYPCLIWLADYVHAAGGKDPATDWRSVAWTERKARRELAKLARAGSGETLVERALDVVAQRNGWVATDVPRPGAVTVGLFTDGADVGIPAIFDGRGRWLVAALGGATMTRTHPIRMWEVPRDRSDTPLGRVAPSAFGVAGSR